MFNSLISVYQQAVRNKNNFSQNETNILWIGLCFLGIVINILICYVLDYYVENNYCNEQTECEELLGLLEDKNDFVLGIIWYFLFAQIVILMSKILFEQTVYIVWLDLSNINGLIYLSSSLWANSLYWTYQQDLDYYIAYRKLMSTYSFLEPIRIITYYYMFGELIIIYTVILPFLLFIFLFVVLLIKNIFTSLINKFNIKKYI
jgi:hypothetical protein